MQALNNIPQLPTLNCMLPRTFTNSIHVLLNVLVKIYNILSEYPHAMRVKGVLESDGEFLRKTDSL